MSPRIFSRWFALLAPALLGGFLWMGLPAAAEAGGWKHGRSQHHERYGKHHRKHDKHHFKHHSRHDGWRGDQRGWYGSHRHHHRGHRYSAPVAVGVYLDGPCGYRYGSWDRFSHHVHQHHGVALVDLPGLLVETSFGFAFHR